MITIWINKGDRLSAAYRLFEQQRFDTDALFAPVRQEVVERLDKDDPLVVMMDDTLIRKRGRKVLGCRPKSFSIVLTQILTQ